jgi:hypothetical protein
MVNMRLLEIAIAVIIIIGFVHWVKNDFKKIDARLDKLEKAITCVQQPQDRHFSMDSLKWYEHRGDIILSTHKPKDNDTALRLYYIK